MLEHDNGDSAYWPLYYRAGLLTSNPGPPLLTIEVFRRSGEVNGNGFGLL